MNEAEIGGVVFHIGDKVDWLRPDGEKVTRTVTGFSKNSRTGELCIKLESGFLFGSRAVAHGEVMLRTSG